MTLFDLLKIFLPYKEIKYRMQRNQLLWNQYIITENMLTNDIQIENDDIIIIEFDDWLYNHRNIIKNQLEIELFDTLCKIFDIKDFFGKEEETNIEIFKHLSEFNILSLSKKQQYIIYKS